MNKEKIDRELGKVISECYEWVLHQVQTKIAKDSMSEYGTELLHFVIIELYNKSPEYKQKLMNDGKVPYWLLTSSGLQLRSGSSPFYNTIRKSKMQTRTGGGVIEELEYEPYDGELYDCFTSAMESLDFYQRHLVQEKYINELSFKEISKKYQISIVHIKSDLYKALELMREHCLHI